MELTPPDDAVITSVAEWSARIRDAGIPMQATLIGELVKTPQEGHAELLIESVDATNETAFASIPIWIDNITWMGPERPPRPSGGRPAWPARAAPDAAYRVTVRGSVTLNRQGAIYVRSAKVDIDRASSGPYSTWRQSQAAQIEDAAAGHPRLARTTDIADYLRDQTSSKRVVWLGRKNTHAYTDVYRNSDGHLPEPKVAGATMHGRAAVKEMCTELGKISAEETSLVIIARGGGDAAGLAVFDDARLLRAVQECPVRTVCAVGHFDDEPLIEQVCDWVLPVPGDIGKALYQAFRGPGPGPTAGGSRLTVQQKGSDRYQQGRDLAEAHAQIARLVSERATAWSRVKHLESECDRALAQVAHLDRLGWMALREETEWRIRQRHRLIAVFLALAAPVVAVLWLRTAPPEWQTSWYQPLVIQALIWVVAAAVGLAPRRLGRRPWIRRANPLDLAAAYRSADSVWAFNRAAAAHGNIEPRLRRRGGRRDRVETRLDRSGSK